MYKIDTDDAVAVEPARPIQGVKKFFTLRTIVPPWWLNMVQNEITNVLVRFGIAANKTNDSQLADAIEAGIASAIAKIKNKCPYYKVIINNNHGLTLPSQFTSNLYEFHIVSFGGIYFGSGFPWNTNSALFSMEVSCTVPTIKTMYLLKVDDEVFVYLNGSLVYSKNNGSWDGSESFNLSLLSGDNLIQIVYNDRGDGNQGLNLFGDIVDNTTVFLK